MGEKQENVMVLSPLSDGAPVTESMTLKADCGHDCYMGLASYETYSEDPRNFRTTCTYCLPPAVLLRMMLGKAQLNMLPGVQAELVRAVGQETTDEIMDRFKPRVVTQEDLDRGKS